MRTFPATTKRNLEGSIFYEQDPSTNGDHAPSWQNSGFYSFPFRTRTRFALCLTEPPGSSTTHPYRLSRSISCEGRPEKSMCWLAHIQTCAPVVATTWRNQLALEEVDDPCFRQFVEQFRISETVPRSGNGCTGGMGEPNL